MESEKNISINTIARLFREVAFQDERTRISSKTVELSTEYIRLFTREAILRSNEERLAEGSLEKVDGIDNVESNRKLENKLDETEARVPDTTVIETENVDASFDKSTEDDVSLDSDIDIPDDLTQRGNAFNPQNELDNTTLDTRHLSRVAGILVLDF